MMTRFNARAVLRHTGTNTPFLHLGENRFRNLWSGKEGEIKDEDLKEKYVINMPLTAMLAENPLIEELIFKLKLKFDK